MIASLVVRSQKQEPTENELTRIMIDIVTDASIEVVAVVPMDIATWIPVVIGKIDIIVIAVTTKVINLGKRKKNQRSTRGIVRILNENIVKRDIDRDLEVIAIAEKDYNI